MKNDGGMASAMTLRDHLAAQAMPALIRLWMCDTCPTADLAAKVSPVDEAIAAAAYASADAMLAARAKAAT